MRQEFAEVDTVEAAGRLCPWACVVYQVCGGYRCFESESDFIIWHQQGSTAIDVCRD